MYFFKHPVTLLLSCWNTAGTHGIKLGAGCESLLLQHPFTLTKAVLRSYQWSLSGFWSVRIQRSAVTLLSQRRRTVYHLNAQFNANCNAIRQVVGRYSSTTVQQSRRASRYCSSYSIRYSIHNQSIDRSSLIITNHESRQTRCSTPDARCQKPAAAVYSSQLVGSFSYMMQYVKLCA